MVKASNTVGTVLVMDHVNTDSNKLSAKGPAGDKQREQFGKNSQSF